MENFNNIVETEVISQPSMNQQQIFENDCYKRRKSILKTDTILDELKKFPEDEEEHTIGHHSNNQFINNNSTIQTSSTSEWNTDKINQNNKSSQSIHKYDKILDNSKDLDKFKVLLNFEDAPKHLQFNPFIRSGYRTFLPTKMCLRSMFWWTNETINIWTHVIGWIIFVGMTFTDLRIMNMYEAFTDKIILLALLICFQLCMLLSSIYHIFSCRSEKDYDSFLTFDLFGIALSLFAIYISGIYYAFWCHESLRNFYSITVAAIFVAAMIIQIPRLNVSSNAKICVFVGWAAYGFIPTLHWTIAMGGFQHPMVKLFIPRVLCMYAIVGIAFLFYITKIPERWFAGKVDYCGHSHNWWHLFVLCALYYWHNTGLVYADFRMNYGCYMLPTLME